MDSIEYANLPGGEILMLGLRDAALQVRSVESLLIQMAAPRLRAHGIVPEQSLHQKQPFHHELYEKLDALYGSDAFARYNSLMQRLDSLLNALDNQSERLNTHKHI